MTLRKKIFGLTAVLLFGLMLVSIIAFIGFNSIGAALTEVTENDIPLTHKLSQTMQYQLEQEVSVAQASIASLAEDADRFEVIRDRLKHFDELDAKVDETLVQALKLAQSGLEHAHDDLARERFAQAIEQVRTINKSHHDYSALVHKQFKYLTNDESTKAHALEKKVHESQAALVTMIQLAYEGIEKETERTTNEAQEIDSIALTSITVVGVVMLILSVVVSILVSRAVMRSLGAEPQQLEHVTSEIASGNHDIDLGDIDSATGVYHSMQKMQQNIRESMAAERKAATENGRVKNALDRVNSNVMIADGDNTIIYLNDSASGMFKAAQQDIRKDLPHFDADTLVGVNIDGFHKNPSHQRNMLAGLTQTHEFSLNVGGRAFFATANPVFGDDGERAGTVVEWEDRTVEVSVENEIEGIVNAAMAGELTGRIELEGKGDFIKRLSSGVNELLDVSEEVINSAAKVFGALARGDLDQYMEGDYSGTFGELKRDANVTVSKLREVIKDDMGRVLGGLARGDLSQTVTSTNEGVFATLADDVNETVGKLQEIVGQISSASAEVASGASEIAQGNTNLSARTEQQASSLEETAASMEEMTSTVKQNADNAQEASKLAYSAREQAERGGKVVSEAVTAMAAISDSSKKISDIIGVIDEIAFQTNLLALNASVEAARAGEQGRGFAVVASEVRNLAGRSASAAKEIKELIIDSVGKVEDGTRLVDESGTTLEDIVGGVQRLTDIVAEIAAASQEQSSGIAQVNTAVMKMDEMTQQNAALVEEASSASAAMGGEARRLQNLVGFFDGGGASAESAPTSISLVSSNVRPGTPMAATRSTPPSKVHVPSTPLAARTGTDGGDSEWEEF